MSGVQQGVGFVDETGGPTPGDILPLTVFAGEAF
jgi:hypothetical protein